MAPSPAKNKSRMSRNTAEIAREICAAIKDVYYDSSKDSFKKRTTDLLNLYKQVCTFYICFVLLQLIYKSDC
jgi:hypothetical protein